jgi:hypothetical protein
MAFATLGRMSRTAAPVITPALIASTPVRRRGETHGH